MHFTKPASFRMGLQAQLLTRGKIQDGSARGSFGGKAFSSLRIQRIWAESTALAKHQMEVSDWLLAQRESAKARANVRANSRTLPEGTQRSGRTIQAA
jgi:hypothetical protein